MSGLLRGRVVPVCLSIGLALSFGCGTDPVEEGGSDTSVANTDIGSSSDDTPVAKTCDCDTSKDTVCARNTCQADGSCKLVPSVDGTPCSDGNPCSVGDTCAKGTCEPGPHSACECQQSADCQDDGDPCNGTLFCDKAILPWRCATKPGSVVSCAPADAACQVAACDPKTGKCGVTNKPDATACDDGEACTKNDACAKGACTGIQTCTCKKDKDCDVNDDGNPCNGTLFCDTKAGKCIVNPKTVIMCPAGKDGPCIVNACSPTTGLCTPTAAKKGTACDDGEPCTTGDRCSGGACVAGTNTCACKADKDCAKHDDGNLCNGLQFCDKQTGTCKHNPGSVVTCKSVDDTNCAHNVCQPKTGTCAMAARKDVTLACKDALDAKGKPTNVCTWRLKQPGDPPDKGPWPCTDGDVCTSGEACVGMKCKASAVTCKCKTNADCATKDDGNLCNGTLYCDKSLKVPDCVFNKASIVFCSKAGDTACLKAACDPKTGKCGNQPVKSGTACDDGQPCTVATTCDAKGTCQGGKPNPCDDGKACTIDSCAEGTKSNPGGCVHVLKKCDDGNACTLDGCDDKTGKCNVGAKKDGTVCNADDNGCTVNDSCQKGACIVGKPLKCTGKDVACYEHTCTSKGPYDFACALTSVKNGTPCADDAKSCFVGASCKADKAGKTSCIPGAKPRYFARTITGFGEHDWSKERAWFKAVAVDAGGDLVAVGGRVVGDVNTSNDWRWLVVKTDLLGDVKWVYQRSGSVASTRQIAAGVAVSPKGALWVAGIEAKKTTHGTALSLRLDTKGKVVGRYAGPATENWLNIRGATALAGGNIAVLGQYLSGSSTRAGYFVHNAAGKKLWNSSLSYEPRAIAGAGHVLLVGYTHKSGSFTTWAYRAMDAATGKFAFGTWAGTKSGNLLQAIAPMPGGEFLVVHTSRFNKGPSYARVLRPIGQARHDTESLGSHLVVQGVAAAKHGTFFAGVHVQGTRTGVIGLLDGNGSVRFRESVDGPEETDLADVVALDGGGAASVGWRKVNGVRSPLLAVHNSLGFSRCTDLGKCAGKVLADCTDGSACTLDGCAPKTGCDHVPEDHNVCKPKDGCSQLGPCKSGTCQTATNGLLYNWDQSWAHLKGVGYDALQATKEGGTVAYTVSKTTVERTVITNYGASRPLGGHPRCKKAAALRDIMITIDDSVVQVGKSTSSGRIVYCRSDKAALVWSRELAPCTGCTPEAVAVDEAVNGDLVLAVDAWRTALKRYVARVVMLTAKGSKQWGSDLTYAKHTRPHAVTAATDGGAIVVGTYGTPETGTAWWAGVDFKGKTRFSLHDTGTSGGAFVAATRMPGKVVLAAGSRNINSKVRTSVLRAFGEADGKLKWARNTSPYDNAAFTAVLGTGDGGSVLAGDIVEAGRNKVFLERLDPLGQRVWRRTYLLNRQYDTATGMRSLAIGQNGYRLGMRPLKSSYGGLLATDTSGHDGCAAAGKCLTSITKSCDDKNSCTPDWCDAVKGCRHQAIKGCK